MFVIPKAGLTVIDPALMNALPPEGRDVGNDYPLYWLRHIQEGSVTVVPEDKVAAAKANAEAAEASRARTAAEAQAAQPADPAKPGAAIPAADSKKTK